MWIVFVGEGRLGNQIFQYTALSSIAPPGARVFAFGLEELESLFELRAARLTTIRGGLWMRRFAKYVLSGLILRPLARWLRLISYAHELEVGGPHAGAAGQLELRRGLFANLVFVDGGYYQNSEYWGALFPPRALALRPEWRARARELIQHKAGRAPERAAFVHVRRGDYAGYSSHGVSDLLLPAEFLHRGIHELLTRGTFDLLVLVTDDPAWAEHEFSHVPGSIVISSDPRTDFALMAGCAGGVVSNSTFSLAAALFMSAPELVIAPRYWFGFRVAEWLPPRIRFDHPQIQYRDVLTAAA